MQHRQTKAKQAHVCKSPYANNHAYFLTCLVTTASNLSKAHVTRDSSGSATWAISVHRAVRFEGVLKFEAFVKKIP